MLRQPERQIILDSKLRVAGRIEPGDLHGGQHAVAVPLRKAFQKCLQSGLPTFHIDEGGGGGVRHGPAELEFAGKIVNGGGKACRLDGATGTDSEPQFGSPRIGR
jgi:hypothetical protein